MSEDFLNCLKHNYAYVAIGEFKHGRFAEAQRLYEKAVSTYQKGFKGAFLLQKPGTDEGIAVIIWNKIEDWEANQSDIHQAIVDEMSPLFLKAPMTDFYEVCSEFDGCSISATRPEEFFDFLKHKYAYVAIGEFKHGRFADAQTLYAKAISTYQQGFKGAFLLQKTGGTDEGIAVIIWDKMEDVEPNQSDIHQAIVAEMTPLFLRAPVTDFYEVCSEINEFKEKSEMLTR